MPTPRGWVVAFIGAATLAAGRLFGSIAVEQLGFALVALVAIAAGVVLLGRHDLEISRSISPDRAHVGQSVTVRISIRNRGRGSTPLVLLEDRTPVGVAGSARFTLQGVEPGGERDAAYELRAVRRGLYEVGPLDVSFIDPFGLARTRQSLATVSRFLVYPRVQPLSLPRDAGDRRSVSTAALRQPVTARGEDFYTLREYAEGDELRKIHWPSTAKRGKLMIRQEETPWHMRATIVLDDRRGVHDGEGSQSSFEQAVAGAASVVDLYHRSGYGFRLTGAHHDGIPNGKGAHHFNRCLDLLAVLQLRGPRSRDDDALRARLSEVESRGGAEETLVVLTGTLEPQTANALARCKRSYKQILVVSWPAHRFGSAPTRSRWEAEGGIVNVTTVLARSGVRVLALGPGESLAHAWSTTSARGGDATWAQKPELV